MRRRIPDRHFSRRLRGDAGFMLLEVILAVFLLAVGLFTLVEGLGRCLAAARSVQTYTIAEALLSNKCYEFRVERPTDFLDQEGTFDDYPDYSWSRTFEPEELVDPITNQNIVGLWKQTITVYWYERGRLVSDAVVEFRYLPQKQR